MKILDGKKVSEGILQDLTLLVEQKKVKPHLAAILVGSNGASETYIASKVKTCKALGFQSTLIRFPEKVSRGELLETIFELNANREVHGILVQLPLPSQIDESEVIGAIRPDKDVDGFHPFNTGLMVQNRGGFLPATPFGIQLLLQHYQLETKGKHAVIIGRSNIVGRPLSIMLSQNNPLGNSTVTLTHSYTPDLQDHTLQADIIIASLGKPGFLKSNMVKEGAIVIDVGITRIPDSTKRSGYRLSGDVDFEQVAPKCSYITPVPGGVGPMTIAALMLNTFKAAGEEIPLPRKIV